MTTDINSENFYSDKVTAVAPLGQSFKQLCRKCDDLHSRCLWKTVTYCRTWKIRWKGRWKIDSFSNQFVFWGVWVISNCTNGYFSKFPTVKKKKIIWFSKNKSLELLPALVREVHGQSLILCIEIIEITLMCMTHSDC